MWIKDFISRSGFANLSVGSSTDNLAVLLQQLPPETQLQKSPTIVRIDDIEVSFNDTVIQRVKILFWNGIPRIPQIINPQVNGWHRDMSLYDAIIEIELSDIPWMIEQRLTFDRQLTLKIAKECMVVFDLDHRELQSISISAA